MSAEPNENVSVFKYDVFVSYRSTDAPFVRDVLLKRLDKEGFKISEYNTTFSAGGFSLRNMIQAVRTSRHTLALVTRGWM